MTTLSPGDGRRSPYILLGVVLIALIYAPSSIAVEKKSKFLTCLFNFFFEETNPSTPQIKRDHGRSDPLMPQTSESHGQSDPLLTRQIKKELDQGEDHVSPDQYDKIVDQVLARHVPQMNAEQFTKVALDIIKNRSGSASGGGFADFEQMRKVFSLVQKHSQTLELNASQIEQIRAAMRKENQGELMWQNLKRDKGIDAFVETASFGKQSHIKSQSEPSANLIQVWTELDQGENHVSPDQYDKIVDQVLARHVPQMNAEQFTKVALDIIKNRSGSASGGGFADFDHMAKVFGLIQKYSQTLELNASQIKRIRAAMRKENQGELMWQNLRRDEDIDDFIDTAPFGKHGSNR